MSTRAPKPKFVPGRRIVTVWLRHSCVAKFDFEIDAQQAREIVDGYSERGEMQHTVYVRHSGGEALFDSKDIIILESKRVLAEVPAARYQ